MEKYKFQAKSEEGLCEKAITELGVTENDILTKVYDEKSGLFGGKKYTIEVVKVQDVAELGKSILNDLLTAMGIKANIEVKVRDTQIKYEIFSKNNSVLIGKRGHILDSIQTYIKQALYNAIDMYANVVIDVENYKEKQNYFLEKKVKRIARDVSLSKVSVTLDPMNSYERRIVHSALQGFKYIETISEGEEPNRRVIIKYKEAKDN